MPDYEMNTMISNWIFLIFTLGVVVTAFKKWGNPTLFRVSGWLVIAWGADMVNGYFTLGHQESIGVLIFQVLGSVVVAWMFFREAKDIERGTKYQATPDNLHTP